VLAARDGAAGGGMTAAALVEVEGLAKTFDVSLPWLNRVAERKQRQFVHAVDDVAFTIARGRTLALVGESGCGKSTVARLLVGLYAPTRGRVIFDGVDAATTRRPAAIRRRMQMIFQDPYASLNPRWRVKDIVAEPLRILKTSKDVSELLVQVGLSPDDGEKYPHEFSGGQRQRISIARALAGEPDFLVCDEPTSALDVSVQAQILNLLRQLQNDLGLSLLFITHNIGVVEYLADDIVVMQRGRVEEKGPTTEVLSRPASAYTRTLLDAVPRMTVG